MEENRPGAAENFFLENRHITVCETKRGGRKEYYCKACAIVVASTSHIKEHVDSRSHTRTSILWKKILELEDEKENFLIEKKRMEASAN
jgi:hypothetical protein